MTEPARRVLVDDGRAAHRGVHYDVDAPERGGRLVEQPLDVELVGDVGADREGRAAGGDDLLDRCLGFGLVAQVDHDHGVPRLASVRAMSRPGPHEPPVTIATASSVGGLPRATMTAGAGSRARGSPGGIPVVYAAVPMAARRPPVLLGRATEREALDRLLENVRGGQSAVLVIRGEAGVGKTALLHHCARQAAGFRVARLAGVESEMELPFAALHQLCAPMLDRVDALPQPQQGALCVAFGLESGAAPDRFLVALAALSLLAEVAGERPLLCFVDDAQWLDAASAQVLGFVARRLLAESVAIVFALRDPTDERELAGLPELTLSGLPEEDARALLATVIPGRLDERVRDRFVAETRGNPLAILELPRAVSGNAGAGRARARRGRARVPGRIEESFQERLEALPQDDPAAAAGGGSGATGRPAARVARGRAARHRVLGRGRRRDRWVAGDRRAGRSSVIRWCARRSTGRPPPPERRAVHLALAEATDPQIDPDRRAWHLAQASTAPDERVAMELERSANRAQARGGLGAAAAFLERGATLSPDPARRAARLLAAAGAKRDAGALDAALRLLGALDAEALDELGRARVEMLHGQIAFDQFRAGEAARYLAGAAKRLEPTDIGLARKTHLEALGAAMYAGDCDGPAGMRIIAEAALRAPPPRGSPAASDALLEGYALLLTQGHAAAAPSLRRARERCSPRTPRRTTTGTGCGSPSPATPSRSRRSCGTPMPGMR